RHIMHAAPEAGHVVFFGTGEGASRRQAGFKRGRHQQLEVAGAHFYILVLGLDDLALLGQAYLAVDRTRRLGHDGVETGAATPAHRAATTVEQAQAGTPRLEYLYQPPLGTVKRPVRCKVAAVFVAVGITQHYFLHT